MKKFTMLIIISAQAAFATGNGDIGSADMPTALRPIGVQLAGDYTQAFCQGAYSKAAAAGLSISSNERTITHQDGKKETVPCVTVETTTSGWPRDTFCKESEQSDKGRLDNGLLTIIPKHVRTQSGHTVTNDSITAYISIANTPGQNELIKLSIKINPEDQSKLIVEQKYTSHTGRAEEVTTCTFVRSN